MVLYKPVLILNQKYLSLLDSQQQQDCIAPQYWLLFYILESKSDSLFSHFNAKVWKVLSFMLASGQPLLDCSCYAVPQSAGSCSKVSTKLNKVVEYRYKEEL